MKAKKYGSHEIQHGIPAILKCFFNLCSHRFAGFEAGNTVRNKKVIQVYDDKKQDDTTGEAHVLREPGSIVAIMTFIFYGTCGIILSCKLQGLNSMNNNGGKKYY